MPSSQLSDHSAVDGVDGDDMVVHVRIPDTMRSYCGIDLTVKGSHVPGGEVTEPAWCAMCVAVQDGLL